MHHLAPYPALEAIEHTLKGYQESYPDLCETRVIGHSSEGRDIWAIRLGKNPKAPVFSLAALFHSMEFPSTLAVMHFLEKVLVNTDDPLLEKTNICAVPVVHPDGYQKVTSLIRGGKKWFVERYTVNGVNLNRNFGAGFESRWKRSPASGPAPFSEPESQALVAWHHRYPPRVSIALHTCGHRLVYPWAFHHGPPPDKKEHLRLAKVFNHHSPHPFKVFQSSHFNGHTGDYMDWVYRDFKAASFLLEMGRAPFTINLFNWARDPFLFFNYPNPKGLMKDVENTAGCFERLWRETPKVKPMTVMDYPPEADYRFSLVF